MPLMLEIRDSFRRYTIVRSSGSSEVPGRHLARAEAQSVVASWLRSAPSAARTLRELYPGPSVGEDHRSSRERRLQRDVERGAVLLVETADSIAADEEFAGARRTGFVDPRYRAPAFVAQKMPRTTDVWAERERPAAPTRDPARGSPSAVASSGFAPSAASPPADAARSGLGLVAGPSGLNAPSGTQARQQPEPDKLFACEWKDCKVNHTSKPAYPSDGRVTRSSSYERDWAKTEEPWLLYGPGTDSRATLEEYRAETPKAKYATVAAGMEHPEYHTQKHHLVSVSLFSSFARIRHNAVLVSYDVNAKRNGMCFPSYVLDIVQHDLQCHRGPHPKALYFDKIRGLLRELERSCASFCHSDAVGSAQTQAQLVAELDLIADRTRTQLRAWNWLLRGEAHEERRRSRDRLEALAAEEAT